MRRARIYLDAVGPRAFLGALRGRLTRRPVLVSVPTDRHGCRSPLWLRVPSSDFRAFSQVFVHQEYDFDVVQKPKVIVDAGANAGFASVHFAQRYPDALIVAIEPENSNFELLMRNVGPYPNIVPIQAALWDKNEEISLVDPGRGKWGFMTQAQSPADDLLGVPLHSVQGITVSEAMSRYGLEEISILKIDIEGAEREVFRDTSAWIDRVDSIIIELHERMKPGCNRSFYYGTPGFADEWSQGENMYLSRGCYIKR